MLVATTSVPANAAAGATATEVKQAGAKHVHESTVTAGGTTAEELRYQLPLQLPNGGTITVNTTQVLESTGSELGILTVGTTGTADSGITSLISSFRLT